MSHAIGEVRFQDGLVMFYEYDGTTDGALPQLRESAQALWDHWRHGIWSECACGRDEPVEIASAYGSGFAWRGRACRHCRAITKTLGFQCDDDFYRTRVDGYPDWWVPIVVS